MSEGILIGQRQQVSVKDVGYTISVPNNCFAKLMYYLNCVDSVIDFSEMGIDIDNLTNYSNYYSLDRSDKNDLIRICEILTPNFLEGKAFFLSQNMAGDSVNKFLEINASETTAAVSSEFMIGSSKIYVKKIMLYKYTWAQNYYHNPLSEANRQISISNVPSTSIHLATLMTFFILQLF